MIASPSAAAHMFDSRLATLEHLLHMGSSHLAEADATHWSRRIAVDMAPLGSQVAYTCNQPRNFALWVSGKPADDLDPAIGSLPTALSRIGETRGMLASLDSQQAFPGRMHLELGPQLFADLDAESYLNDFLVPNFYFHLVTSYAILRNAGVPVGKADYMRHLAPRVQAR